MSSVSNPMILAISVSIFCFMILMIALYRFTFEKSYNKKTRYYVMLRYKDREEAANILHQLNIFTMKLLDRMSEHYKHNESSMKLINNMIHKYDPDYLEENDPTFTVGHKTFTLNFQKISICLRKKSGEFYDMNTLQFVMMHELSHIAALEKEHNDYFWLIFKFILHSATMVGYTPINYALYPFDYCGINVSHNPYFSEYDISNYLSLLPSNTAGHHGDDGAHDNN